MEFFSFFYISRELLKIISASLTCIPETPAILLFWLIIILNQNYCETFIAANNLSIQKERDGASLFVFKLIHWQHKWILKYHTKYDHWHQLCQHHLQHLDVKGQTDIIVIFIILQNVLRMSLSLHLWLLRCASAPCLMFSSLWVISLCVSVLIRLVHLSDEFIVVTFSNGRYN